MIDRHAARRTAVLGLAAAGAFALAAPASALGIGDPVPAGAQVNPDGTYVLDGKLFDAAGNLIKEVAPAPVAPVVEGPVNTVQETVGTLTAPAQQPPAATPPQGSPPQEQPQSQPQQQPQSQPQTQPQGASSPPAGAPAGTVTATSLSGVGFAAAPGPIGSLSRSGFGVGSGMAANPMSLFGAPQVAFPSTLDTAPSVASPQVFTPAGAGAALPDLIPVGSESVPGYLTALACAVVAGAAGAHVAALRGRRTAGPAAA